MIELDKDLRQLLEIHFHIFTKLEEIRNMLRRDMKMWRIHIIKTQ